MSYLIAIDIGIKNLGLCVFDFHTAQVVHWTTTAITEKRYMAAQNVEYVRAFMARYSEYFGSCAYLILERQMRCNMRILEACFNFALHDRCVVISPRSVKVHYGIGTGDYRRNKQRATEWCRLFSQNNSQLFADGVLQEFAIARKADDMADALLLTLYYLDTFSNQLTNDE